MKAELTKIIAQYLDGELSETDRIAFEEKLKSNLELQEEVAFQQTLMEAAKRSGIRSQVQSASKGFHLTQNIKWTGITLGIVAIITAASFFIYKQVSENKSIDLSEFSEIIEKVKDQELIKDLSSEFFAWNGQDTAMLSQNGILISIPESAFLLNGKPYTEPALIQFQEALDAATIVKSGLSTVSNGKLLETQGMFSFTAFSKSGEKLTINPKTGIYIQIPVDEYKKDMQLFTGVEGKDGIINWVNPKPLAKIPVAINMKDLNFYPPSYEDSLNAMKLRKDKKYRDSLYLSCEDNISIDDSVMQRSVIDDPKVEVKNTHYPYKPNGGDWTDKISWTFKLEKIDESHAFVVGTAKLKDGWHVFSVKHDPKKADLTGYPTRFNFDSSDKYSIEKELVDGIQPQIVKDDLGTSVYFNKLAIFKQEITIDTEEDFNLTFDYSFQICDENGCIFPPDQTATLKVKGYSAAKEKDPLNHISPSKVLAFWKPQFNNTILATREFEKRMRAIHSTCNNKVLEVYTKNLDQPLSELDQKVVKMGFSNFEGFVSENVGALNPNNPHVKTLTAFYEKAVNDYRDEVKRNRDREQKRRTTWDDKVTKERSKESDRSVQRENQAFAEEYTLNHKNVRKQLGRTLGMTIYTNAQICNIDRFVMQTTLARKTDEFYDSETGKTARIQYNEFTVNVANPDQYTKIYAYLFPHELNSYQRISGTNGKFSYPLNDAIVYDLAIVGISEKGYSYFQKSTFNEGNIGTVNLENVSEVKLNASIEQLNNLRISKPMNIKEELDWLIIEQKNYVEKRNRMNEYLFKERIKKIVFPCYSGVAHGVAAPKEPIIKFGI